MAAYTTIDDPEAYFQTVIYTGNGSANHAITLPADTDMQPDLVWIKNRDAADSHCLFDAVRGATKVMHVDTGAAEATDADTLDSFTSDGFQVDADVKVNTNTEDYVAWNWKAGGSTSSNTTGATSSTVSVNSTSKFSIVQWTGTGSTTTVGHSLGVVPDMFITRSTGTSSWGVYHKGAASSPEDGSMQLDADSAWYDHTAYYNDTAPTSTVFTVNSDDSVNKSGTMMAYCFTSIQGFSKFGSYTGNENADGPFVYTGFRPAFVLIKNTEDTLEWEIFDNKRDGYNDANRRLHPSSAIAEPGASARVRILSNGFKLVTSGGTNVNGSGEVLIYAAFAEAPFVNSNGVPCNAR